MKVASMRGITVPSGLLFLLVPVLVSCGSTPSTSSSSGATGANVSSSVSTLPAVPGAFNATGNMLTSRIAHTATLLPNGQVLIVGGGEGPDLIDGFFTVSGAEIFDPATGTFSSAGSDARDFGTATLLKTGKVLVTGGDTGPVITPSAELYDPGPVCFNQPGT